MKMNNELGFEFTEVKKPDNKPTFRGFLRFIWLKIYLRSYVKRKEMYEYLTYVSQLVKAVKELEAINRTQITGLLYKFSEMENKEGDDSVDNSNNDDNKTNYRGQYQ